MCASVVLCVIWWGVGVELEWGKKREERKKTWICVCGVMHILLLFVKSMYYMLGVCYMLYIGYIVICFNLDLCYVGYMSTNTNPTLTQLINGNLCIRADYICDNNKVCTIGSCVHIYSVLVNTTCQQFQLAPVSFYIYLYIYVFL